MVRVGDVGTHCLTVVPDDGHEELTHWRKQNGVDTSVDTARRSARATQTHFLTVARHFLTCNRFLWSRLVTIAALGRNALPDGRASLTAPNAARIVGRESPLPYGRGSVKTV